MTIHQFIKLKTSRSRKKHTTLPQRRHSCYSGWSLWATNHFKLLHNLHL